MAAHPASATSKQRVVRDHLLSMRAGMTIGAPLPPERQLAQSLGVSRLTLRAAVQQLVAEGLLMRRQGSGTFVAQPAVAQPLTLTSFSEDMRRRGMRPGSRVLTFGVDFAGAKTGSRLQMSPRSRVWVVRRLRLADDMPMAIETLHLPQSLLPDLIREDLENSSLYEYLRERGIEMGPGSQVIETTVTDEQESSLLMLPVLSPAFLFERITHDRQGQAIEYVRSVYRGDRYRLLAELRPSLA
ncbi:MAG TPA: GntR family transcriptional regulator [Nocardioidaceae bacterium]|nr:GntR family transcriptional regulator [Nocardioidaceae bacterium]